MSLARVDFFRAPILLLDDCLSAVDVNTENKIMHSLLRGSWEGCTRILATHRLSILSQVSRILFLKNGELIAQGSYQQLLHTNPEFREYTQSVNRENSSAQELS